ncbi:MAG: hypothetical protein ACI9D0_000578 [Bacteroidia bacterium]
MSGAVSGIPGFQNIEIKKDIKDFKVTYDANETSEAVIMAAIEAVGEKVHPTD